MLDIQLPGAVGAKWANYDVFDLETGDYCRFQERSRITNDKVLAGKGVKKKYCQAEVYAWRYGGIPENWKQIKGIGKIET